MDVKWNEDPLGSVRLKQLHPGETYTTQRMADRPGGDHRSIWLVCKKPSDDFRVPAGMVPVVTLRSGSLTFKPKSEVVYPVEVTATACLKKRA